jgi:hypothetical protein
MRPALFFIRLIHSIASDYSKNLVNLLKNKKVINFYKIQ